VEHNNFKRQYYFAEGNQITFRIRRGERITGIMTEVTDSSMTVDNKIYKLADIAKIKRRTASPYPKVIGAFFIATGFLFIVYATEDVAEPFVLTGMSTMAVGIALIVEPAFKVGVNCRLRVASEAAYVNRR